MPVTFEQYKATVASVTKKDLQALAKSYFTPDHYVRVVLMPEVEK